MKKLKKIVIGNWKVNPLTLAEAKKIATEVKRGLRGVVKTQTVICPPVVYLPSLSRMASLNFLLGAQDAFYESFGPYTGEVSAKQLPEFQVSHVIVGHSERRARGESDEIVNKKVKAVIGEGMTAVICVGERERDQHGEYLETIKNQIVSALRDISKKSLEHLIIAYEPAWLIGGKGAMDPRDIDETALYIKKVLREIYGILADSIRILYGASVMPETAGQIMKGGFVQGLLVGRDSLNPQKFLEIIKVVEKQK